MISRGDLSIRQLEYLVTVADELGFRRAAELLHVSQPTLSAQIQQVEAVLGFAVFERSARRVLVTAAGERIVEHARKVLLAVDDLLAEATRVRDPFTGAIRIGIIPTVAPYLLAEVMPALGAAYPKLRLSFREEKTETALGYLRAGQIDAAIVALVDDTADLAHAVITEDAFVVALPKGHPLTKKKRVALQDLEDETVLLLDEGHCLRAQALALCQRVGAKETELRATSLSTLVQMISTGAGVTLLPELAVPVENRRGQLEVRPIAPQAPTRTIALVWRPESPLGSALRTLGGTMRSALASSAT
jgi:LysR family hydrogen peroxide-inducible transcriptional activator